MRRPPLIIMMARWPGIGRGKTRLAATASPVIAANFQWHSITALIKRFGDDKRWDLTLALTPKATWRRARRHRLTSGARLIDQGSGDLGTRMTRLFRQYGTPARPVIIIGSDTPHVSQVDILSASRALTRHDLVFGPAEDGGYWLIGWSGRRISHHRQGFPPLTQVRWSTEHALVDTQVSLKRHCSNDPKIILLRHRIDVDNASDLQATGPVRRVCAR